MNYISLVHVFQQLHSQVHFSEDEVFNIILCDICHRYYPQPRMKKHMRVHTHRPHKCHLCPKTFKDKRQLIDHNNVHNGIKPFKCPVCDRFFTQESQVRKHMKVHTGVKPFKCSMCERYFRERHSLKIHEKTHSKPPRIYKCLMCPEICDDRFQLKKHRKIHFPPIEPRPSIDFTNLLNHHLEGVENSTENMEGNPGIVSNNGAITKSYGAGLSLPNQPPEGFGINIFNDEFSCEICGKFFRTQGLLNKHQGAHSDELPYCCEVCGKRFKSKYTLPKHIKNMHSEAKHLRPYKCQFCPKSYKQSNHLADHMTIHTGRIYHECPECKKKFTQKSSLKKHFRIHTGERPYKCQVCGESFASTVAHKVHLVTHMDKLSLKCDLCGEVVEGHQELKTHKRRIHGKKYDKRIKFLSSNDDASGKAAKKTTCNVCGREFKWKQSLKKHKLTHQYNQDELPHSCHICNRRFLCKTYLKEHLLVHSNKKNEICPHCGKEYSHKSSLRSHIRNYHAGDLNFPCNYCDESFTQRIKLQMHVLTHAHLNETQFNCPICNKVFTDRIKLQEHEEIHKHSYGGEEHEDARAEMSDVSMSGALSDDGYDDDDDEGTRHEDFNYIELQLHKTKSSAVSNAGKDVSMKDNDSTFDTEVLKYREFEDLFEDISADQPYCCLQCSSSFSSKLKRRNHTMIVHSKHSDEVRRPLLMVAPYYCQVHVFSSKRKQKPGEFYIR